MRKIIPIAIILGARLLASPPPAANPERLLEAAIYQAKVVGNLPVAIQQLDAIATQYAGKPVAARALVEMGHAEEQLGHADRARGAYTRVLKDYRDQVQLVAQVRQSIESLSADTPAGPRNLSFEQGEPGKVPEGWFVPSVLAKEGYSAELRRTGCRSTIGCVVVMVPATQPEKMFGNLMQSFPATAYRGKTVRLHAWLRLEATSKTDSAQMWFRVDRSNRKTGFFDNMTNRPVRAATWTEAQIVGKIDDDAQSINIGVISLGGGRAWVDGMTFEVIADTTPTTGPFEPRNMPKEPANLSFDSGETGSVPTGWFTAVGKSQLERQGCRSAACASVWLPEGATQPFGNIMQTWSAENYRGKTVRIRAWLRVDTTTPADAAQMWFRVDRANHKTGGFDNMGDRPVKSALWVPAEIVVKVDADAEALNLGVMAPGKGRAWVDGMTFEVVPDGTSATGQYTGGLAQAQPATPQNLNFARGQAGKVPEDWFTPVGKAELSSQGCHSSACVAIWLDPGSNHEFANLMQTVSAAPFRGKTVRLRAWLRLDAAAKGDKAQMWLRVDRADDQHGAFDNMDDRPVQSSGWTQAEIVGRIAADAETLNFGAISVGNGRAWVDGMTLEVVPDSTPSTGPYQSH